MTVTVAGSLGRLEASPHSDVDCIVIVDDRQDFHPEQISASIEQIRIELLGVGLQPPKADGIYCRPIGASHLLDPLNRGSLDEAPTIFGTRMQLLLDARPLYQVDEFISLRGRLLRWYGWPNEHRGSWTHLLNDLSRYLHAYAVWQQFKFSRSDNDGWYLRQAKLRSTRMATFAGLLFTLGETTVRGNGEDETLAQALNRTPLGRLQTAFDRYPAVNFSAVIEIYEALHQLLADPSVRRDLIRLSPTSLAEIPARHVGAYAQIHELSEELMAQLTGFILARANDWSPRIFRSWLL